MLGALGLGGAVASAATAITSLTLLSGHRVWLLVVTGVLLTLSWAAMAGWLRGSWLRPIGCPADGAQPQSHRLWWFSVTIYVITVGVTYLGGPLTRLMKAGP